MPLAPFGGGKADTRADQLFRAKTRSVMAPCSRSLVYRSWFESEERFIARIGCPCRERTKTATREAGARTVATPRTIRSEPCQVGDTRSSGRVSRRTKRSSTVKENYVGCWESSKGVHISERRDHSSWGLDVLQRAGLPLLSRSVWRNGTQRCCRLRSRSPYTFGQLRRDF